MRLLILRFREWLLEGDVAHLTGRLAEIENQYERDLRDGRARLLAAVGNLRRVRNRIALQASPEIVLKDSVR